MAVCKVEELEWDALLVCSDTERGKEKVDEARVAWTLVVCWEMGRELRVRWRWLWRRCWNVLWWCWSWRNAGAVGLRLHGDVVEVFPDVVRRRKIDEIDGLFRAMFFKRKHAHARCLSKDLLRLQSSGGCI